MEAKAGQRQQRQTERREIATNSEPTCMRARTWRDRDWTCRQCALHNFGRKLKCNGCGDGKSQVEEWYLSRVRPDTNAGKAFAKFAKRNRDVQRAEQVVAWGGTGFSMQLRKTPFLLRYRHHHRRHARMRALLLKGHNGQRKW